MSASDTEKRIVSHAVAHSVNANYRLFSNAPCSFATVPCLRKARWARKEAKIAKIKTPDAKGRFKAEHADPGSLSAGTATSSKRVQPAVHL
jgi:hypothetical protein